METMRSLRRKSGWMMSTICGRRSGWEAAGAEVFPRVGTKRRREELLAIGREPGVEESDLQLNLESLKMESTRLVLNQKDLITGGEGEGVMRGGKKARKQVKCWKMGRLWRLQGGKGGDDTGRPMSIRVLKTMVPQVFSRPLS